MLSQYSIIICFPYNFVLIFILCITLLLIDFLRLLEINYLEHLMVCVNLVQTNISTIWLSKERGKGLEMSDSNKREHLDKAMWSLASYLWARDTSLDKYSLNFSTGWLKVILCQEGAFQLVQAFLIHFCSYNYLYEQVGVTPCRWNEYKLKRRCLKLVIPES